jgi:putative pyruvate formate lyase activating enzyme
MSSEAMELLKHVIDIWLPDFKYGNNSCALRLSKIPRYVDIVGRNHKIAVEWGDMIIRHLVLPNHVECCSKKVLKWIADNLPKERVLVNIMDQYRPEYKAYEYEDIARRPYAEELEEVYSYAESLGLLWKDISH